MCYLFMLYLALPVQIIYSTINILFQIEPDYKFVCDDFPLSTHH